MCPLEKLVRDGNITDGVKLLLGNPKKAIVKLALPMTVGIMVQALYNVADAIWVSGLGPKNLAAVGLFAPIFMIVVALASGIAVGGSTAVSRQIGARNKQGVDSIAIHSIVIGFIVSILATALFLPFLKNIFKILTSDSELVNLTVEYSQIIIGGIFIWIYSNIVGGILRGEGAAKKVMKIMVIGAFLNIVLDPVFIYLLNLGIKGAAWASLVSVSVSAVVSSFWLFLKKDTYVDVSFRGFKFDCSIVLEILKVGLPAVISQIAMSSSVFVVNGIVSKVGGSDGIAVFTGVWRVVMFGIMPMFALASGVSAVVGASFGEKNYGKLETAYLFGIKAGLVVEVSFAVFVFASAPLISHLFSFSGGEEFHQKLVYAYRTMIWFVPFTPFGIITASMFQGIGRGVNALVVALFRTLVMRILFSYLLGIYFGMGLTGVLLGIVLGNVIAAVVSFIWGKYTIRSLRLSVSKI